MAGLVRSRSTSGAFATVPTIRRGKQHGAQRFVEKGFDTNDHSALNQSLSVIPLAYEFFTLSRRPQRAGMANAIVAA
jgi:hypothetical protein